MILAADINCLNTPTSFTQASLGNVRVALIYQKFISFYGDQIFIIVEE